MRSLGVIPVTGGLTSGRTVPVSGRPSASLAGGAPPVPRVGPGSGDERYLLPAPWRGRLGLMVGAAALWVLGWAVAVDGSRGPLRVEHPLNDLLTGSRPYLVHVAFAFASLNVPLVFAAVLAAMLGLCAGGRSARAAVTLVAALPATFVVCELLKLHTDRYNSFGTPTFPSGHVGVASVLATVTVLLARRRGPLGRRLARPVGVWLMAVAVAVVAAVAASMVILGAHFVTDTIAAAPIGVSVTLVAARAADSLARRSAPGR